MGIGVPSRAAKVYETSAKLPDFIMQPQQGSIKGDKSTFPEGQINPYLGLIESLAGEVITNYARGARVLDAGARAPRISRWVARVSPYPLTQWLGPDEALPREVDNLKIEHADHSFDMVYSMWTFSQFGQNEQESRIMAASFVEECDRVLRPGGYLLMHARNAVSLRGAWARTGRQLISFPFGRDKREYERWDSLSQFVRLLPPNLELVDGHGLGVLTLNAQLLQVPILGRITRALEWKLRDSRGLRHLAGDMLCVMRRVPEPQDLPTSPSALA